MGYEHVRQYKFSRLALGFHPLYASENKSELRLFSQCLDKTSYIGEIGLDFSNEGLKTKDDQVFVLEKVLQLLSEKINSKCPFQTSRKSLVRNVGYLWH